MQNLDKLDLLPHGDGMVQTETSKIMLIGFKGEQQ